MWTESRHSGRCGLDVIAGQQPIAWNAALRFMVCPQASAACYDQSGNRVPLGCWRLLDGVACGQTWECEPRLASVTAGGKVTTFTYGGDGNLVREVGYDNLAAGLPAQGWRQRSHGAAMNELLCSSRPGR